MKTSEFSCIHKDSGSGTTSAGIITISVNPLITKLHFVIIYAVTDPLQPDGNYQCSSWSYPPSSYLIVFKPSRRQNSMKFSGADIRVRMSRPSDVSGITPSPIFRVCWWFGSNKRSVLVLPNHQHALQMGTELVSETSENLHILMRLSARGNFIVVNCSNTHVSGNWSVPITSFGVVTNMSAEMDPSRGDRRALGSLFFFYLTVPWLIADERFTESDSGERFKSYIDNRQCVLLCICREPNE